MLVHQPLGFEANMGIPKTSLRVVDHTRVAARAGELFSVCALFCLRSFFQHTLLSLNNHPLICLNCFLAAGRARSVSWFKGSRVCYEGLKSGWGENVRRNLLEWTETLLKGTKQREERPRENTGEKAWARGLKVARESFFQGCGQCLSDATADETSPHLGLCCLT
jgi:hypothetical protein